MVFQKYMGTEIALSQMHRASNQRQNRIAILDLKSAYDRVGRAALMKRCEDVLPEGLEKMVSHIIHELEVHEVGDKMGTTAKINRGVTQAGPASPTLFNRYIDTLASQQCASVGNIERTPVRLYADDVILLADSLRELVFGVANLFQMGKREQYGIVDGCSEKSHIAEIHQKQALQVAAIRTRKNTNHDQHDQRTSECK